ncbi:MAG: type II toxin-antitoxin system RelE/ParE family toxin [Pseudomonadota bacterium]
MANYKLSRAAKDDLERIYMRGLEQFGEQQADLYIQAFFNQFELIAETPDRYPKAENIRTGYRRSICGRDVIYFRIVDEVVEITAILGKQDHRGWL